MNQPLLKVVSFRPDPHEGVGPTLQALREARGLSLGDVSLRLKYSVQLLAALEAEDWSSLPQGVLLRGMVKNYARHVETDPEALLIMLDSQTSTAKTTPSGAPRPVPVQQAAAPASGTWSWGWLLVILVVVAVVAFYAIERGWVPDNWLVFDWLRSSKP